ncbi:MAG: hypothetical protein K2Q26_08860 [Bdellovibrionales bacterium]|nr:hypothetical protein [Bdellovibrionales bacterium]
MKSLCWAVILLSALGVCAAPQPAAPPRPVVCSPWKQLNREEQHQATQLLRNYESRQPELRRRYPLNLSLLNHPDFLDRLARGILQNETGCRENSFTFWKNTEPFPSLGLLHAIWYPAGAKSQLTESFPPLIQFLRAEIQKHPQFPARIPQWLDVDKIGPSPWQNKQEFDLASKNAEALRRSDDLSSLRSLNPRAYHQAVQFRELHDFLRHPSVLALQARYAAYRMQRSVYNILAAAESSHQTQHIYTQLQRLITTEEGIFSLIDYINFKGEGINPGEVTAIGNHAWGLKTVLENMRNQTPAHTFCQRNHSEFHDGRCANVQFTLASKFALHRLAAHRGENGSACQQEGLSLIQRADGSRGGWTARIEDNYMPGRLAQPRCPNVPVQQLHSSSGTTISR